MIRGARHQRRRFAHAPENRAKFTCPPARQRRLRLEALEDRQLLATAGGATVSVEVDESYTPTALIVQFRPEAQYASSLSAHMAGSLVGSPWEIAPGMREVALTPGANLDEALRAFSSDPNVLFAEPDYRVRLNMLPNDPKFASDQWHLNNTGQLEEPGMDIRAPAAWDITTGSPMVVVAVIDTGVDYNHPDLAPNMWRNLGELSGEIGVDDDGNGYIDDVYGYDFANNDANPMDDHLHGTHIAGTIAAVGNNGIGTSGVAPGARIMALKFLDKSGNGLTSNAISALNYAVRNGASISNNSFGGGPISQAFKAAIFNASGGGHIFVAAAGNYSNNNDTNPFYPANYELDNIISVAATDGADDIAWFSNYGKQTVDVGAPGIDIYSTFPSTITDEMRDRGITESYGTLSGTSMAAPVAAGVLALVRSHFSGLSAREVIDQVMATVDRSSSLMSKTVSGGRVNAAAALGLVEADTTFPHVLSSDPAGIVSGTVSKVRLNFSEPMDASSFDLSDVIGMEGPSGPVFIVDVTASPLDSRQFTVTFESQTEPGQYSLSIGPHVQDLAGNELDQDGDGAGGVDGADEYTATFNIAEVEAEVFAATDVPIEISEFDPITSYITITDDLPIADLNVHIDVTFPRIGSLHIWLVSPNGTVIDLSERHGGEGEDFFDTTFDDEAEISLFDGEAPYTGAFQPDDPLSELDLKNAQGTWQLVVQNVSETSNRGSLNGWSLEIVRGETGGGGGEEEINDPPIAGTDAFTLFQGELLIVSPSELMANDTDPNDDSLEFVSLHSADGGTVEFNEDGDIVFQPTLSGLGLASFEYVISDGTFTAIGIVFVTLRAQFQLHNGLDVNDDGLVTAKDALLVINYLNAFGIRPIIDVGISSTPTLFYDVVADNIIKPSDALTVINHINAFGMGPLSAGSSLTTTTDTDELDAAAVDGILTDDDDETWL